MSRLVVLDSGPLGMVTNPKATPLSIQATRWLRDLLASGVTVAVAEIADYEVRRELVRRGRSAALSWLDDLTEKLVYLPITTPVMRRAAGLWASCRNEGRPLAAPNALDCDVILAAQAAEVVSDYDDVVIATTNPGHLSRLVTARNWQEIE